MTKLFRRELTPHFLAAARRKPAGLLPTLLAATQLVRDTILLPASKNLADIEIHRKDTGSQRSSDAKTFSIETDHHCEAVMERELRAAFPDALLISEEKYGASTPAQQQALLEEALKTDKRVILTDPLDATRDFRGGGDGYGTMVAVVEKGEIVAAVAHRSTDAADPRGYGHTLTYEKGDAVRRDGQALAPLDKRSFPADPLQLRGYAALEFIAPMRGGTDLAEEGFPNLAGKFDSLSDLWTASKLYDDLITGRHHFMLAPAPTDIFDYPAGIALIRQAGGAVRYLDGTEATFAEVVKRQDFSGSADPAKISLGNTLVFAVSEEVFKTVQKTVYAAAGLTPPAAASPAAAPKP